MKILEPYIFFIFILLLIQIQSFSIEFSTLRLFKKVNIFRIFKNCINDLTINFNRCLIKNHFSYKLEQVFVSLLLIIALPVLIYFCLFSFEKYRIHFELILTSYLVLLSLFFIFIENINITKNVYRVLFMFCVFYMSYKTLFFFEDKEYLNDFYVSSNQTWGNIYTHAGLTLASYLSLLEINNYILKHKTNNQLIKNLMLVTGTVIFITFSMNGGNDYILFFLLEHTKDNLYYECLLLVFLLKFFIVVLFSDHLHMGYFKIIQKYDLAIFKTEVILVLSIALSVIYGNFYV